MSLNEKIEMLIQSAQEITEQDIDNVSFQDFITFFDNDPSFESSKKIKSLVAKKVGRIHKGHNFGLLTDPKDIPKKQRPIHEKMLENSEMIRQLNHAVNDYKEATLDNKETKNQALLTIKEILTVFEEKELEVKNPTPKNKNLFQKIFG